jgi:hypothetical protein
MRNMFLNDDNIAAAPLGYSVDPPAERILSAAAALTASTRTVRGLVRSP